MPLAIRKGNFAGRHEGAFLIYSVEGIFKLNLMEKPSRKFNRDCFPLKLPASFSVKCGLKVRQEEPI